MNYQKIYNQLITRRQNEILPKNIYGEIHHIVPKCLGGTNENSNLVRLTAREHYIAHLLLAKIYDNIGLYYVVIKMKYGNQQQKRDYKFNSRLYQKMRDEYSKKCSELRTGENHPRFGKHCSDETKKKISESKKGKEPWNKGKSGVYSEESKNKMSESQKGNKNCVGRVLSNKTKKKISEKNKGQIPWNKGGKGLQVAWNKGVPMNEESKQKLSQKRSESNKGKFWFNNGKINVFQYECPEGFVRGMLKKKSQEQ